MLRPRPLGCALIVGLLTGFAPAAPLSAQTPGTAAALTSAASKPPAAPQYAPVLDPDDEPVLLDHLTVRDADLRDVFRSIAQAYDLNLVVDNRIQARVTLRLSGVPVLDAVAFLCRQNELLLSQHGAIFRIDLPPQPEPPPPPPLDVTFRDSLLSFDLRAADLERTLRALQEVTGANIVLRQGVRGAVTGSLRDVPLDVGLRAILATNGFALRRKDAIYHVDRLGFVEGEHAAGARTFWVQVDGTGVALDLHDAPIANVVRELGAQVDSVNLVTYEVPEGRITLRATGLSLEDALTLVLKGTGTTVRRDGATYTIGNADTHGVTATRLVRLDHLRADTALALLPDALSTSAAIQVVKEHNGLMVSGPPDLIREIEAFTREIDYPTPQILIEALVVDFESTDLLQLGLSFGRDPERAEANRRGRYDFHTDGADPGFSFETEGRRLNKAVEYNPLLGDLFGLHKIGRLPDDFYLRLQALDEDGKVNIRSRPQIATLNGHTANISIGTTQYYLLNTNTYLPYQQTTGHVPNLQSAQRFEKIEANVRLEITPWVSRSGEVTAEIRPEFSAPVGDFDPDVAPTINTRVLESTVRLQDGETIILGGMIREYEQTVHRKVPGLGSIPLLGRLFRSTNAQARKSELVIFLTPHVFLGDDDDAKWHDLRESLDLEAEPDGLIEIGHTRTRGRSNRR